MKYSFQMKFNLGKTGYVFNSRPSQSRYVVGNYSQILNLILNITTMKKIAFKTYMLTMLGFSILIFSSFCISAKTYKEKAEFLILVETTKDGIKLTSEKRLCLERVNCES